MVTSTLTPESPKPVLYQPVRGAHIYVERDCFSHHGIDCGDGTVIDFAGRGGGKATAMIGRVTLAEFANGAPIRGRHYGTCHPPEIVVARATAMIGRSGYDLFPNNCEHFATWCVTGEYSSAQVEAVWSTVGMVGVGKLAPSIGRSAVVGLGETAPRSAANVMSGLTRLGGSAIGGVAVVAGAGGVVGAGTMTLALRDKSYLTDQERTARRAGRVAGVGGAAVGPLVRSAVYGAAGLDEQREVYRTLAEATDPESDPDRRAWHRAQASSVPDEDVAAELEHSAARAQARGGLAASAAFLERAVALSPEPSRRAQRALAAAQTKFQAGALDDALELLETAESGAAVDDLVRADPHLLRAQIEFTSRRGSDAPRLLLQAARHLEQLDLDLARKTYLDTLSAAMFAGRLATPGAGALEVARAMSKVGTPGVRPQRSNRSSKYRCVGQQSATKRFDAKETVRNGLPTT